MFGGARSQKILKRHHLIDAESIQKTLNFTTTNAILVKLTTDIYLNKVFHLAKILERNSEGVGYKLKNSQNEPKSFLAQF